MEKVLAIRLSTEDKKELKRLAAMHRISVSAYVRQQLFHGYN